MNPNDFSFFNPDTSLVYNPEFNAFKGFDSTGFNTPALSANQNLGGLTGNDWKSIWLGSKDSLGLGQLGLGTLSSFMNWNLGKKQLGLSEDIFDFQKQMAQENLARQKATQKGNISDRADARAGAYGSNAAQLRASDLAKYGY